MTYIEMVGYSLW